MNNYDSFFLICIISFTPLFAVTSQFKSAIKKLEKMHPRYSPAPPPQQQQQMGGPPHQQQGGGGGGGVSMRGPSNAQQLPPQIPRSQNYSNVSQIHIASL